MTIRVAQSSLLIGLIAFFPAAGAKAQSCLTWVHRTDVGSPGQRAHHAMAYDSDRHVTVFFGGEIGTTGNESYFNDTWEYDGTHWTQITINGSKPSPRSTHSMAYDPIHHQIVMQGGQDSGGIKSDTWLYQGNGTSGTWTQVTGSSIISAEGAMVWDSVDSQVLLFQGNDAGAQGPDTARYLWNGSSYTLTAEGYFTDGPNIFYREGMVFDPVLGKAISAGGYRRQVSGAGAYVTSEAFAFKENGYAAQIVSLPSARQYPMMAYDSRRKRTVIVGGDNADAGTGESVLEYDSARPGLGWQAGVQLPSGFGRAGGAMVYDEARGVMVLMGGAGAGAPNGNDGGRYSDTWELTPMLFTSTIDAPQGNLCAGDTILLTAHPSDNRALKYQWSVQPTPAITPYPVTTNATLVFSNFDFPGTYHFAVSMEDECGNKNYKVADIHFYSKPKVTSVLHTGDNYQCPGGSYQMTVQYDSELPATLQWFHDNLPLFGQTNAILTLSNLVKEDSGSYVLSVRNQCGEATNSDHTTFYLRVGPAITSHPPSVTANPCDGADFSVVAIGIGTLHYQWRMEGVPLTEGGPFTGTTSTNLHIKPLVYSLERTFDVVVTDDCGPENAAISSPASLALPTPPWVEVEMKPSPPEQENRRGNWVSAYDENRSVLVMYGGTDFRGYRENSLWEYDGFTWTPIQDAFQGPVTTNGQNLFFNNTTAPSSFAAVYDPDDHLTYIFGEASRSTPLTIWTWNGTNWNRPYSGPVTGGEQFYRAVYDRLNHRILLTRTHDNGYGSELLVYDPASNTLNAPQVMQPPLELGVFHAFWVYDEYRQLGLWYQIDHVGNGPPTMWALEPSMSWIKLIGTPTPPDFAYFDVTYDSVRRHVVEFGDAGDYPFHTSTRIFPGSGQTGLPSASDWLETLPDGPPRNAAGLGISPTNTFFPETIAFDRHRRALVAPGYAVPFPWGTPRRFPPGPLTSRATRTRWCSIVRPLSADRQSAGPYPSKPMSPVMAR